MDNDIKMEEPTAPSLDHAPASSSDSAPAASIETAKAKPYRSWKKKYQKLRVTFDDKMEENEKLHKQEVMALHTTKRLAVEIDRILDLLLDVNNTPQIPASKRIDLSLPPAEHGSLDIDMPGGWARRFHTKGGGGGDTSVLEPPAKSLKDLLRDVPHMDLATVTKQAPELLHDLVPSKDNARAFAPPDDYSMPQPWNQTPVPPSQPAGQHKEKAAAAVEKKTYPESFLTADDIDNYLWEVDRNVAARALLAGESAPPMVPTLAPFANLPDMKVTVHGKEGSGWDEFFSRSICKADLPSLMTMSAATTTRDGILHNPTSVYNWLREHAPKSIFLHEGEATAAAQAAALAAAAAAAEKDGAGAASDSYHHYTHGANGSGGAGGAAGVSASAARKRKSTAASADKPIKAEKPDKADGKAPRGSRASGKRASTAAAAAAAGGSSLARELLTPHDDADSDDASVEPSTPRSGPTTIRGGNNKRKRAAAADDDVAATTVSRAKAAAAAAGAGGGSSNGAAPSSGSSRAAKRKRKSDGGSRDDDLDTPTATPVVAKKRQRKSAAAAAAAAADTEGEGASEAAADIDADGDVDAAGEMMGDDGH